MKNLLVILTMTSLFSQFSLAKNKSTIQFFCGSTTNPTYEFPVNFSGSVQEINHGHFSEQILVSEFELRNGSTKVALAPFHHYCSVSIEYLNQTNNVFNTSGDLLFSKKAKLATSCEGGPLQINECTIDVNSNQDLSY